jgi:hypothetical protein
VQEVLDASPLRFFAVGVWGSSSFVVIGGLLLGWGMTRKGMSSVVVLLDMELFVTLYPGGEWGAVSIGWDKVKLWASSNVVNTLNFAFGNLLSPCSIDPW